LAHPYSRNTSRHWCDDSLSSWSDEVDEVSKPLQQSLLIDQVECEDINEGNFLQVKLYDLKSKISKKFVAKVQTITDTTNYCLTHAPIYSEWQKYGINSLKIKQNFFQKNLWTGQF
jgi:hypothetical protein